MSRRPRFIQVGTLGAALALFGASCGTDLVNLLPESGGFGGGGQGGSAEAGALSGGFSGTGGQAGSGGDTGGTMGGHVDRGGGGGASGSGGCFGFGCGASGEGRGGDGFGDGFGDGLSCGVLNSCDPCRDDTDCTGMEHCLGEICVQCAAQSHCDGDMRCNFTTGRCGPACTDDSQCPGGICNLAQGTCSGCNRQEECQRTGDPQKRVCFWHRCVQCKEDAHCTQWPRKFCSTWQQCVECREDKHCEDPLRCNASSGTCEP